MSDDPNFIAALTARSGSPVTAAQFQPRQSRWAARMGHLIITRFAVPRPESDSIGVYRDPKWLDERFDLFRRFYVPSVARCGVPAILLCGHEVAEQVAARVADLDWATVEVQDEWQAGWTDPEGRTLTRLDSDDAIHPGWFQAVDEVTSSAPILTTREYLRLDLQSWRVHHYARKEPASLTAFRNGVNPYGRDHRFLTDPTETHVIEGAYLLQVFHGGNVSNKPLRPWRIDRWTSRDRLAEFGIPTSR